jgi:hypothetical protein
VIQLAARNAQRAAARCGGRAYRASGRRLAILATPDAASSASDALVLIESEFIAGPVIRVVDAVPEDGEHASAVLERARDELSAEER